MRARAIIRLAVWLLAAAATTVPAQAQGTMERTQRISGVVRASGSNQPADRARVVLTQRGFHRGEVFTNGSGNFQFLGVGRGEYLIQVYLQGYRVARQTVTITTFISKHILIYLEPEQTAGPLLGAPVSAAELALPAAARRQRDKGMQALGEGKCKSGVAAFQKLVRAEPAYAGGYYGLGMGYYFCNDYPRAETALHRAIQLDASLLPAYVLLGRLLNNRERFADAHAAIRDAADRPPPRGDLLLELGRALTGMGRTADAERALRRAHSLEEAGAHLHVQLANVLVMRGDLAGALEEMRHYLAADPHGELVAEVRQKVALLESELARQASVREP